MTCTVIAVCMLGGLGPAIEDLTNDNAVLRDPVVAPYSELVLLHAGIKHQTTNHSLWLIAEKGRGRRIAKEAVDPQCVGVLPNDPVAVVIDRAGGENALRLADLRDGSVAATVPEFGIGIRKVLPDGLTQRLLLVATDKDGALGLYRFGVEAWYRAKPENRESLKPVKVWSLTSDPVDLVFSRDGQRVAMLDGEAIQLLDLGRVVTSRTLRFPGMVLHPRDFHPTRNLLLFETVTPVPGFVEPFGEVGVLDFVTGAQKPAIYFRYQTEPVKSPRFDSSGDFLVVNTLTNGYEFMNEAPSNGYVEAPRPVPFWVNWDRTNVSFYGISPAVPGGNESLRPLCVTFSVDHRINDAVRKFAQPVVVLDEIASDMGYQMGTRPIIGNPGGALTWQETSAYSPTASGQLLSASSAYSHTAAPQTMHDAGSIIVKWNVRQRRVVTLPPGPQNPLQLTEGSILFGATEREEGRYFGVWNYPDWSHYGP